MSREHYRQDGREKHPFINPDAAKRAAVALQKRGDSAVVAYECGECCNWHVGRPRSYYEALANADRNAQPMDQIAAFSISTCAIALGATLDRAFEIAQIVDAEFAGSGSTQWARPASERVRELVLENAGQ